ncbi:TPA: InlB B-repeat-containing protein [Streptococcus equi subsp. zooepidemicus]|nr:InlB B-repeat-containing protein [Streptococcus equi subsp. zooepidemicus]
MKRKKRLPWIMAIILAFVMILPNMINVHADQNVRINHADFTANGFKEPVADETIPKESKVTVVDSVKLKIDGDSSVSWKEEQADGTLGEPTSDKFEANKKYRLRLSVDKLTLKTVDALDGKNMTAKVNDIEVSKDEKIQDSKSGGVDTVQISFVLYSKSFQPKENPNPLPKEYTIKVEGGKAYGVGGLKAGGPEIKKAKVGDLISIKADAAPEGEKFDKWVVEQGGDNLLTSEEDEVTGFNMPAENVVIKATYVPLPVVPVEEHKITIKNGKSFNLGTTDEIDKAVNGTDVQIEADEPAIEKEFDKWIVVKGNVDIADISEPITGFEMPDTDVEIEATYKDRAVTPIPAKEYKISYDLNGGMLDGKTGVVTTIVKDGGVIKLPNSPVKDGYVFREWNTAADGHGTAFVGNTVAHDNITVYAIYNKKAEILNEAPKLEVKDKTIEKGDNFNLMNLVVKAFDKEDDDIINKVKIVDNGGFDKNKAGDYIITFEVKDSKGAIAKAKAKVMVKDNTVTPQNPKPNTPEKPNSQNSNSNTPQTQNSMPSNSNNHSESKVNEITPNNLPKTGDSSNIVLFAGLLALSAGALVSFGVYRRFKTRNEN